MFSQRKNLFSVPCSMCNAIFASYILYFGYHMVFTRFSQSYHCFSLLRYINLISMLVIYLKKSMQPLRTSKYLWILFILYEVRKLFMPYIGFSPFEMSLSCKGFQLRHYFVMCSYITRGIKVTIVPCLKGTVQAKGKKSLIFVRFWWKFVHIWKLENKMG